MGCSGYNPNNTIGIGSNNNQPGFQSCYDAVDSLINYTFYYPSESENSICSIKPNITFYNININNSYNGDRIWNFVFGGTTNNAKYDAVFQFSPNCYVPNGVDTAQLKDLTFYKNNSTTEYEPFQGYIVINGVVVGLSGGEFGPSGTPSNTNNQIVTPEWNAETATFTMKINLNNAYVGWFSIGNYQQTLGGGYLTQFNWQPCNSSTTNSVFFNLWIRDGIRTGSGAR
jgi:hypothetical protein